MKTIVNSAQMKAVDDYTVEKVGIPAIVLMERAALSVIDEMKKHGVTKEKILAVCGIGNNGADGVAAARILYLQSYTVAILLVGDEDKASPLLKQQLLIARNLGISIYNNIAITEYTIIIDAIFGIGLSRNISGIYKEIIEEINAGSHTVYSVDIPSGLSADTAKPMDIAIKADYTITFGLNKIGLILYPGCEYAGNVIVEEIGFPEIAVNQVNSPYFSYDTNDLNKLPKRLNYSNKGTFGKVLVIAGSVNISGACYFSAKAAYRAGSGLVKVMTAEENRIIIQSQLPEALLYTYKSDNWDDCTEEQILKEIEWAKVIVIGPGIGMSNTSGRLLDLVLEHAKVPVILDADGINLLSEKVNSMHNDNSRIENIVSILPKQTILTPHLKELSVLLDMPLDTIINNLLGIADICTCKNDLITVLKDARTIVANKKERYINISGNNGMSTGGSGDVLTGIIAAFIAQGLEAKEAAKLGVYTHGLAGDKARELKGSYCLIASDIIDALAQVLNNND
ncbi:NAD(P)H-hydrate dehydratase [Anaerocolumna sedimenticola]|uniref:Bifunctional NAD(P)H-hydrate repair enzyme n=1 Tax=Anaerocolumna sedimenticola TaxID=2696063 RepID=A0A6P1TS10_9FIRM|nr:NAD(P)H-hydrate dehydratase [Anaerocolumna sedimenticola]QHQ62536.1 NAD(P)H-hydrate dehydratase [Anaerocolumna sedimenticola]